ncbi:MAG: succinate dehydrogenase cytochrome b subunit [Microscillaceae bacterium]|nr:succinate dehydrogenase cytochrome b subunit [Microscillaceae bacterium]MDW8461463.1 succinate dehydrogenase cytochrome b subunit [Cytophagales bacterium]
MSTATAKPNWFIQMISSTIGKKLIMALTGLFLITFLVVHLLGNLQLLKGDNGVTFNKYAHFMGHNPLIQTISVVNFTFILLHVVYAIILARLNTQARPQPYVYVQPQASSPWYARNMMLLGTIVLIFIVVHLQNFWFQMKFGYVAKVTYDNVEYKDLYTMTKEAFANPVIVAFYVLAMVGLAYHLAHGFQSAFQTLGLRHVKYTPVIQFVGKVFCIVVPLLYAMIPIIMYIQSLS